VNSFAGASFNGAAFAGSLGWAAGALVVVLAATYVASKIAGKHSVVDTVWGLLFVTVAVVSFVTSSGYGHAVRRWLLLALTVLWGLRLAVHIGRRSVGKGEDPRYEALLDKAKGSRELYAFVMIYLLQGVLAFVIAAPIMVGSYEPGPVGVLAWVGVALWGVGVFFEAVGDMQMERFKEDPANKGKLIDVGLWRYTRHPNYFGDACVWWGIFLVAADALPGFVTVFSPLIMTLLLTVGSGARTLEKSMSKREGWDGYAARTSMFFPLPPKVKKSVSSG
jgi:steroid 5-alpha reductase family enzyme